MKRGCKAADSEPQNWFTGGRDQDGTYYSPLQDIDAGNVKNLGFAWSYDLGDPQRGQEATPIVIDGVMYTSGTWGYVYAVDAATGKELWRYDPKAEPFFGRNPCCDLVNRGVAVWKGKVYVASSDGRLHALDAATGHKIWDADTIVDHKLPYSSTGAPQIAGGVVVIGNGGGDIGHGARARLRLRLRPGDRRTSNGASTPCRRRPGQPLENPELAAAAKDLGSASRPAIQRRRHGLGRLRLRPGARSWCISAPAMRRPTICASSATPSSTACTPPRSSRCMPTPGGSPGTTRRRRTITGITTPSRK